MTTMPGETGARTAAVVGLIAAAVFSAFILTGCPTQDETTTTQAKTTTTPAPKVEVPAIVKDKCALCHGLKDSAGAELTDAGKGQPPFKSFKGQFQTLVPRADWKPTIDRMRNINKCEMTDAEAEETIGFLNKNFKQ